MGALLDKGAHLSNLTQDKEGRILMHPAAVYELCDKHVSHSKLWRPAGLADVLDVNTLLDVVLSGANQPTKVGAHRHPPRVVNVCGREPSLPGSPPSVPWR